MAQGNILIIDNEKRMCHVLKVALEADGHSIELAFDGEEGINKLKASDFDVIITDLKMPGKDGMAVLEAAKQIKPSCEVIMMTAYATAQTAVEAMHKGAYDYLIKPFEIIELRLKVKQILEKQQLAVENIDLKQRLMEKYSIDNIIGQSQTMQKVYHMVEKVAPSDATVLIRGESGTGKELVAQAIHNMSPRTQKPLVKINCAAIPDNMIEAELFGHTKGAFTGAHIAKKGRFQVADGSTLFLDEIGDLSASAQAKLLRFVESGEIQRVGSTEILQVDVRIVAASNKKLEQMVIEKTFREDLYYRLNGFPIFIPPLRERREDILLLLDYFIDKFAEEFGVIKPTLTPAANNYLKGYDWPGNVRQLCHFVERLLVLSATELIDLEDVKQLLTPQNETATSMTPNHNLTLAEARNQFEKKYIIEILESNQWRVAKAAEVLAVDRANLYRKMRQLGIEAGK